MDGYKGIKEANRATVATLEVNTEAEAASLRHLLTSAYRRSLLFRPRSEEGGTETRSGPAGGRFW